MKSSHLPRRIAVALAIGLALPSGWSLTVGRAQGVALIGRTLEVAVPLGLDGAADTAPQCAQAEIYYGDSRVDPSRVTADVQSGVAGTTVRVRSTAAVNEPVVTLYLHVGCSSKVTRRFVLLSEQPDPVAEAPRVPFAAPGPTPRRGAPERPTARAATEPSDTPTMLPTVPAGPGARTTPGAATPPMPGAAPTAAAPRRAASSRALLGAPTASVRSAPRLKLEPLDLSEERDPTLRMSAQLATAEGSPERRAQAQALWRALIARPEDILREAQRIETLERDVGALRQSLQRNDSAVAGLRTELEAKRSERFANPVVYGLLALLLALLAAAVVAWRRGRWDAARGGDWWRTQDGADSEMFSLPPSTARSRPGTLGDDADLVSHPGDLDFELRSAHSPLHAAQERTRPQHELGLREGAHQDDFRHSEATSMRAVRAEELQDVQQEADFFVSLGDFDRAIEVLRNHISLNPGTSAVAWLDLLDIHHKLGQREKYDAVRGEFLRNFDVQVPSFEGYLEGQAGLEQYSSAIDRITALWPSRKVLELIEESIFREPGKAGAEAFNLEAYRDLLLLHQIGRDLREASFADSENATRSGFANTAIQPLSAEGAAELSPDLELDDLGGLKSHVDLDLNLDDLGPAGTAAPIGHAVAREQTHDNLMDFDLPDIDTTNLRAKKTRE